MFVCSERESPFLDNIVWTNLNQKLLSKCNLVFLFYFIYSSRV